MKWYVYVCFEGKKIEVARFIDETDANIFVEMKNKKSNNQSIKYELKLKS